MRTSHLLFPRYTSEPWALLDSDGTSATSHKHILLPNEASSTSTRRLYVHRAVANEFVARLADAYASVRIGDPLDEKTLLGPLHTRHAIGVYEKAVHTLRSSGADIVTGGRRCSEGNLINGNFVEPTISMPSTVDPVHPIWSTETFAPILNVAVFDELEQAIGWNNGVPQGLSSSLWTRDLRNVGKWIGPGGSDTGIVNVCVALATCATATVTDAQFGNQG